MDVLVALEYRFDRTPDGVVWSQSVYGQSFWARYLQVFEGVTVVARLREVPSACEGWVRSDAEAVTFASVPYYVGPWQYLRCARRVREAARAALSPDRAVILRVPSNVASSFVPTLWQRGHPYAVEVVGDPYDVFAPGAVRHPLRPLFRQLLPWQLRRQCARACAAAYVTKEALQRRYPARSGAFTTYYSSVELPEEAFVPADRPIRDPGAPATLICVGTMAQLYKAQDVLIDAVAICAQTGLDLRLILVGDGRNRLELEKRARHAGLMERVEFTGQLPSGVAVRAQLDRADLFVLPSRQEGLPRAMIEAMARGLPCIGSTVGGIPELLAPEDMVPPDSVAALAGMIKRIVGDPERMRRMGARNRQVATEYCADILNQRRYEFYRYVRDATAARLPLRRPV